MRFPELFGVNRDIGNRNVSQAVKDLMHTLPDQRSYVYETTAPIDGIERIYAYQKLGNSPFWMTVGRATADFVTAWRQTAVLLASLSLAMAVMLAWVARRLVLREAERKKNEQSLQLAQQQLETFIRHAPISIAMFDRTMRYLAYSGRWLMEYGRGYENLIGRSHYDVHPDVPDAWKHAHQEGLKGATLKKDGEMWTQADGSQHWLRWAVLPWTETDGKIAGIIISAEDITESKRTESDLRTVLEEAGDAIWIADSAGRYIYANPAACTLTAHTLGELRNMRIPDLVHENIPGELSDHLARLQSVKYIRNEWQLNRKDGGIVCIELTTEKLPDGRYLAIGRDQTERKRAEALLREKDNLLARMSAMTHTGGWAFDP